MCTLVENVCLVGKKLPREDYASLHLETVEVRLAGYIQCRFRSEGRLIYTRDFGQNNIS